MSFGFLTFGRKLLVFVRRLSEVISRFCVCTQISLYSCSLEWILVGSSLGLKLELEEM